MNSPATRFGYPVLPEYLPQYLPELMPIRLLPKLPFPYLGNNEIRRYWFCHVNQVKRPSLFRFSGNHNETAVVRNPRIPVGPLVVGQAYQLPTPDIVTVDLPFAVHL